MRIADKFIYDENSPTCLLHKYSIFLNNAEIVKAGTVAGYLRFYKDGRPRNSCVSNGKDKQEYLHRIVFLLHYGEIPEGCVIDHIDGNPHNNKISNLRAVKGAINARNVKKHRTNTSGHTGVSFLQDKNGTTRWRAVWYEDTKYKSKSFSCEIYGYEQAKQLAIEFRATQIAMLNKIGYNYSERHGN